MVTLGDVTVVNNDVGDDAEGPERDRGRQHDRDPALCQRPQSFSDVQMLDTTRADILAAATADLAQESRECRRHSPRLETDIRPASYHQC